MSSTTFRSGSTRLTVIRAAACSTGRSGMRSSDGNAHGDRVSWWRRVSSPLFVELHWLDGLTWRMLAMTIAIVSPTMIGTTIRGMQYGDVGMPPVMPAFVFEAFALPILVAALSNLRRPALPLPLILIVALLLVSLVGRGV